MIQCVESRNDEHPYCSRVCCSEAVKNALEIKRRLPGANVVVLGRDIRTYGFRELYFQKAREAGVLFVRHPEKGDPVVVEEDGRLKVTRARRLEQPRPGAAARPAGALHRHRPGRRQPGAVRAAAQRPHRRRLLPGGASQAAPGGSGQRGRVPLRPGPLAAVHRRDHRPGQGRGRAGHHRPLQDAPGDPRPGRQGRSGELRGLRHLREGLPVRRADDQRAQQGRDPGRQVHGLRQLRGRLPGQDHHAAAPGRTRHWSPCSTSCWSDGGAP